IKIDSYALFGEFSYDITDSLNASIGARYSHDRKRFTTSLLRQSAGIVTLPETTITNSWNKVSPRFSLKYRFGDNATVYATVTSGFKSGGFNGRATSLAEI